MYAANDMNDSWIPFLFEVLSFDQKTVLAWGVWIGACLNPAIDCFSFLWREPYEPSWSTGFPVFLLDPKHGYDLYKENSQFSSGKISSKTVALNSACSILSLQARGQPNMRHPIVETKCLQTNAMCSTTLPETKIAPENWWLEDHFPFWDAHLFNLVSHKIPMARGFSLHPAQPKSTGLLTQSTSYKL